jgi:hypothetical protein
MKVVLWAKNMYRVFEEWSRVTKRWNLSSQKLVQEFRETTFYIMDQTGRYDFGIGGGGCCRINF